MSTSLGRPPDPSHSSLSLALRLTLKALPVGQPGGHHSISHLLHWPASPMEMGGLALIHCPPPTTSSVPHTLIHHSLIHSLNKRSPGSSHGTGSMPALRISCHTGQKKASLFPQCLNSLLRLVEGLQNSSSWRLLHVGGSLGPGRQKSAGRGKPPGTGGPD